MNGSDVRHLTCALVFTSPIVSPTKPVRRDGPQVMRGTAEGIAPGRIPPGRPSTPEHRELRFKHSRLAVAATAGLLAFPAGADAGSQYVVTLDVPATTTCDRVVHDVTTDYAIVPGTVYTSALCGFTASMSTSKARALSVEPRVLSVEAEEAPGDFTCQRCGTEGDLYRRGTCVRCALRDDLTVMMINSAHDPDAIVDALCRNGSCPPSAASPHTSGRDGICSARPNGEPRWPTASRSGVRSPRPTLPPEM